MKFSIIIVTYNRKKKLVDCLNSIRNQSCNWNFEVLVILNGDSTYLEKYKREFPDFKFYLISQTSLAASRNFATNIGCGEYFYFLSDDAILPPNFFSKICFEHELKNWDVLGGPCKIPANSLPLKVLTKKVLASPLCMGPYAALKHFSANKKSLSVTDDYLSLSNLWVKSSIFKIDGYKFDADKFKNDGMIFLLKLSLLKYKMCYLPELFIYKNVDFNLEKLAAALIRSGSTRIYHLHGNLRKRDLYYFFPLFFLIVFLSAVFTASKILFLLIALYSFVVFVYGIYRHHFLSLRFLIFHFFVLFSYSIGSIHGLYQRLILFYNNFIENKSLISESKSR